MGLAGSMFHFWCPVPVPVQVRTSTQTYRETLAPKILVRYEPLGGKDMEIRKRRNEGPTSRFTYFNPFNTFHLCIHNKYLPV